jgi:ubiquinone biosynthesis protein COQ4
MRLLGTLCNKEVGQFIRTNLAQRLALTAGSGLLSIFDPTRDDMISAFGELTSDYTLPRLYNLMQNDAEGAQILHDRPIINSKTIDLSKLAKLPVGTFGREYFDFLECNQITPDSRKPVRFIENQDYSYVMQRYREIHDFTHCILGMKTNMLGEVTVKVFEAIQLGLPMCWLAGLFGVLRLGPKHTQQYLDCNLPWITHTALNSRHLINVYFEKNFEKPVDQFRAELNLTKFDEFQKTQ